MKKIISALLLCLPAGFVHAAGPYDGIWTIDGLPEAGYIMTSENGGRLIFVGLNPPDVDGAPRPTAPPCEAPRRGLDTGHIFGRVSHAFRPAASSDHAPAEDRDGTG